jgi:hypothetical protein
MKKNYVLLQVLIALLSLGSMRLAAQALSGNYTIDQTQVASSTNFVSFNAFATAINANGVSGPVNVSVLNGPYNEQVLFTSISGSSAMNRITINGNNNLITFNSSNFSLPQVIGMNGADNFTFNNLNMQGTGTYAYVCILYGGSDNNVFSNCTFSVNANNTSSNQIPVVMSGALTSYASSGNSGSNNTFIGCTMYSGYASVWMYGLTSAPYNFDNKIVNCNLLDWYYCGVYSYYSKNLHMTGNIIERPTRTSFTTAYGSFFIYNHGLLCESNKYRRFFDGNTSATNSMYAIYGYYTPVPNQGSPNVVRNNMIYDMKHNGSVYGIYYYYPDGTFYNNTISLDYANATGGTTYGVYTYGGTNYTSDFRNNIVSISRGGSGTKYCINIPVTGNMTSDRNDLYMGSTTGATYIAAYSGNWTTLAAYQASGLDASSFSVNPMFASITNSLYPTNTAIDNAAIDLELLFDNAGAVRHPTTPDIGALEFLTPLCAGQPSMTVNAPTYSLCPGESAMVGLGNLSSDLGYTYQWYTSSISNVGPWTAVPSGTSIVTSVLNVTATTWVSAIIACTSPGGSSIQPVGQVNVAGTTSNTVPYHEGFEGIGLSNRLPNCSWMAPGLGLSARTYTSSMPNNLLPNTGNGFAAFNTNATGANYFYTNGIWLDANVTYSASMWYMTDFSGSTNWSNLAILYGSAQATTGLTQIASVSPAVSPFYKSLSNTFNVTTSGLYYIAIRGTGASGTALNLTWDDLRITVPCQVAPNSPALTLSANNTTVCSGDPVTLTAGGADAYSWNTGANTGVITENPIVNTTFMVTGTNTLTGCSVSASQLVVVKPSPVISLFSFPPTVCAGKQANLQASGGTSYTWNVPGQGSNINVTPNTTTQYMVMGSGANGCVGSSAITVSVNTLPTVSGVPSNQQVCPTDALTLSGTGAVTYQWVSNNPAMVLTGQNITMNLTTSTTFTVFGTDANGCEDTDVFAVTVDACTGINELVSGNTMNVYPNPSTGVFNISTGSTEEVNVSVSDVTGRLVYTSRGTAHFSVDLSNVAAGVYYVKCESADGAAVARLIKE